MLTKRFTATAAIPFDRVKTFDMEALNLDKRDDLFGLLEALEAAPEYCIVRAAPMAEGLKQRRLLREKNGDAATLLPIEEGLPWIMLDLDKVPAPASLTPEERIDFLVARLPEPFREATCYFQWSSSAGTKDWTSLSAHFWYWLETPIACANLQRRSAFKLGDWYNAVDYAPFSPAQIHYTASPIFQGREDPLGTARSGVRKGARDTAPVRPWVEPYIPRSTLSRAAVERQSPGTSLTAMLEEIGAPHYHLPIIRAVAHYIATVPLMLRDKTGLFERILERASLGRDYIDAAYLEDVWRSADAKFTPCC